MTEDYEQYDQYDYSSDGCSAEYDDYTGEVLQELRDSAIPLSISWTSPDRMTVQLGDQEHGVVGRVDGIG